MQTAHIRFLDLFNGPVQYVVPRWQRRYRWGRRDIERLVDDLLAIAAAGADAAHYGGTLLTFPEPGAPAGLVTRKRVVDGQQRLTTVSVLLACIAEKLGPEGKCGDWNAKKIRDYRLTNPDNSEDKFYKLRLQPGDDEEYRNGLEGRAAGSGAVTQAWRIVSRLVAKNDTAQLLKGIERFKAVSIGLDHHEDPQQIFESLNATGQPLTESEKVKNWLLMGLPESEQKALHDQHWSVMEEELGTGADSGPTDIFLRDLLRWRTESFKASTVATRVCVAGRCGRGDLTIVRRSAASSRGWLVSTASLPALPEPTPTQRWSRISTTCESWEYTYIDPSACDSLTTQPAPTAKPPRTRISRRPSRPSASGSPDSG